MRLRILLKIQVINGSARRALGVFVAIAGIMRYNTIES